MMFMRQRNVKNKKEIINNSHYVILNPKDYCGKWNLVFNNQHPIYVEIGMGKGDFIYQNAQKYPEINFIGIEKFDSILSIAIKKINDNLPNLRFIRLDAIEIDEVFKNEISKLFLNFSDPWPKKRHAKRRLTSSIFLHKYNNLFLLDQIIEMKTDNRHLFEYSLVSFNENNYQIEEISLDLHSDDFPNNIETEYERKFSALNNVIYYVKVKKKNESL